MLDHLKSLSCQEGGTRSFRYPTEKVDVHGMNIPVFWKYKKSLTFILKLVLVIREKLKDNECEYY